MTQPIQTFPARDLHAFLQEPEHFQRWLRTVITELELVQDVDFFEKEQSCLFSIEAAKEISITSRTKIGKEVRKFLIACEKVAVQEETPAERFFRMDEFAREWDEAFGKTGIFGQLQ